ncbi:MAG: hypothetical protein AB7P76_07040 [Candidatus Melainabacteria bacterium]
MRVPAPGAGAGHPSCSALPGFSKRTSRSDRTPVLLLQGAFAGPESMTSLGDTLREDGFEPHYPIRGLHLPLVPAARDRRIAGAVEEIRQETGEEPFAVGWSWGGMSGRRHARRGLVTMGSPLALPDRHARHALPTVSLYSPADVVILPPLSMVSGQKVHSEALSPVLHWDLPAHPGVIRRVRQALNDLRIQEQAVAPAPAGRSRRRQSA